MTTDEGGKVAIAGRRGVMAASVMTMTTTAAMRGGKTRRRRRRGRRMGRDEGRQASMIMTSRTTIVRTAPAVPGGQGHPVTVTQVMTRKGRLPKRPCGTHWSRLIQQTLRR